MSDNAFMNVGKFEQKILTYFIRGKITVRLTSCLTGLDWNKQSYWIQTRKSGGQLYSDIYH